MGEIKKISNENDGNYTINPCEHQSEKQPDCGVTFTISATQASPESYTHNQIKIVVKLHGNTILLSHNAIRNDQTSKKLFEPKLDIYRNLYGSFKTLNAHKEMNQILCKLDAKEKCLDFSNIINEEKIQLQKNIKQNKNLGQSETVVVDYELNKLALQGNKSLNAKGNIPVIRKKFLEDSIGKKQMKEKSMKTKRSKNELINKAQEQTELKTEEKREVYPKKEDMLDDAKKTDNEEIKLAIKESETKDVIVRRKKETDKEVEQIMKENKTKDVIVSRIIDEDKEGNYYETDKEEIKHIMKDFEIKDVFSRQTNDEIVRQNIDEDKEGNYYETETVTDKEDIKHTMKENKTKDEIVKRKINEDEEEYKIKEYIAEDKTSNSKVDEYKEENEFETETEIDEETKDIQKGYVGEGGIEDTTLIVKIDEDLKENYPVKITNIDNVEKS
eukprot:GAHX01002030.1.p1 GENE.GAHX01002030.1~~GAHX01002030.1.p1  ORF type:complete len:444 (-),score=137.50 GAHX01002030.1:495-1826(-)